MAIFKTPRITTAQREALILEPSEIVYDVDKSTFYGGDGVKLGGFLIGGYGTQSIDYIAVQLIVTQTDIDNKRIVLPGTPLSPTDVTLTIKGGIAQINTEDFIVDGNAIIWENLGLDGFLEVGDLLLVEYSMSEPIGLNVQMVTITQQLLNDKQVTLTQTPSNPTSVTLDIKGGIPQIYGEDFTISGNILTWNNLGLDGFLELGDVLIIEF